jgi:isopenicillin-N epimerase
VEIPRTPDPDLVARWRLDPTVTFLNHGSFGACPVEVLDHQRQLRDRLEAEPVRFFLREHQGLLDTARDALAELLGAAPGRLAFVANATTGVNTVLRSLRFGPGDEILVTDHEYPACRNAVDRVAAESGARVAVAEVPFPLTDGDSASAALLGRVGARTRLVVVDHVTSQTGLALPVETIVSELASRGVPVLVDGAHAPGMLALGLDRLGADFYTGNCHKWLCAPKGAGFLYVREPDRWPVVPLVTSHGAGAPPGHRPRFLVEMDWTGTSDPTARLSVPAAIRAVGAMVPGGWDAVRARNRGLALAARTLLCARLGVEPPCPDQMIGSLVSLPLPDGDGAPHEIDPLQEALWQRHRIEVPVIPWPRPPRRLLRISAMLYNGLDQYRRLADALADELQGA